MWEHVAITKEVEEEITILQDMLKVIANMPKMRAIRILLYLQNYVCHDNGVSPLAVKMANDLIEKITKKQEAST